MSHGRVRVNSVEASCSFKSGVTRKKRLTALFGDSRFGDFLRLSTLCILLVGVLQLLEQFFSEKADPSQWAHTRTEKGNSLSSQEPLQSRSLKHWRNRRRSFLHCKVLLVVLCILRNWFEYVPIPGTLTSTDEWQNFRSDKKKWTEFSQHIEKIVVDVIGKLPDNDAVRQDIKESIEQLSVYVI
jgi:hypothetical protein